MSSFNADWHGVCSLALHCLLAFLPDMFLVPVEGLLVGSPLQVLILVHVPLGPHNVSLGGGHGDTSTPHPPLVPWLLGPVE